MKWLSVDKFTPPSCTDVIIRALRNINVYDRYFIGMIEDFNKIKNLEDWILSNDIMFNAKDYIVTHFAIIDAIEKE